MTEGPVVAEGEVPFVILPDERVVVACFRVTPLSRPSFGETESISWTLALDGRDFEVIGDDEEPWVPMDERWASRGMKPMTAHPAGGSFVVSYHYFYGHHYGWLSGDVTLTFDDVAMTVSVSKDLVFDPD